MGASRRRLACSSKFTPARPNHRVGWDCWNRADAHNGVERLLLSNEGGGVATDWRAWSDTPPDRCEKVRKILVRASGRREVPPRAEGAEALRRRNGAVLVDEARSAQQQSCPDRRASKLTRSSERQEATLTGRPRKPPELRKDRYRKYPGEPGYKPPRSRKSGTTGTGPRTAERTLLVGGAPRNVVNSGENRAPQSPNGSTPRSLRRAADEVQQLDGVVVVLIGGRRRRTRVPHHLRACVCQQLGVALAPLRQRFHCFERPVGMTTDVLSQIFSEGRNDASLSSHFQRSHGIGPVLAGRGRHRHLSPPFSRDFQGFPHRAAENGWSAARTRERAGGTHPETASPGQVFFNRAGPHPLYLQRLSLLPVVVDR
jgi:hypothetical protein